VRSNSARRAASSLDCSSFPTECDGTKNKSLSLSFGSGTMHRNLYTDPFFSMFLNFGDALRCLLQTSCSSCEGSCCHCATAVFPTAVVFADSATNLVCPEPPFCLWPFPPHACASESHLWPRLGRGGRFPHSQLKSCSHVHFLAAAAAAAESLDLLLDFPMAANK
jgi:hypothetical protein